MMQVEESPPDRPLIPASLSVYKMHVFVTTLSWLIQVYLIKWKKAPLTVPLSPASPTVYKMHAFVTTLSFLIQVSYPLRHHLSTKCNFKLFDSSIFDRSHLQLCGKQES